MGHPEDASKERKWGTWAGVWRTLAIRLDGASIIGIRDSLSSPFACSNQVSMTRGNRYSAPRRGVASVTLRCSGGVTTEVGITAFHPPPFSTVSSLAARILFYPISQHFLQSPGRIIPCWFSGRGNDDAVDGVLHTISGRS